MELNSNKLDLSNTNPSIRIRKRMAALKPLLPANYRDLLFQTNPEYSTPEGRKHLSNVVAGNKVDDILTQLLEQIVIAHREAINSAAL